MLRASGRLASRTATIRQGDLVVGRQQESLATDSTGHSTGSRVGESLALFLLVLAIAAPFAHHYGEQQGSRYALTAALWDRQTVVLDEYTHLLGRDRAVVDGVTYSDKAPGQPFLMVPFYAVYRLAGGEPPDTLVWEGDLGMWWLTVWSAAIPGALLAVLMYRWAQQVQRNKALVATLTMSLGTLLLVYSTILFGHVLAALALFGMFLLLRDEDASRWRLFAAGLLGGAAVLIEYPAALVVMVLVVAAVVRHRGRVLAVVGGGIPAAVLLVLYNIRLFGSPFVFTYQWSAFSGAKEEANELVGIFAGPTLERLAHVLVSPRGLLIATPVIAVCLVGMVLLWRKGSRFDAAVAAGAFLVMLAVQGSWSTSYAGGAGPRYVVPALPFLVAPLAVVWARWRLITSVLAGIGVVTIVAATLTEPQLASQFEAGLRFWLTRLVGGEFTSTVYTLAVGGWGWAVHIMSVAVAGLWLARNMRSRIV